ncbi:MAG: hypothetical protein AAF074_03410 [Pseudomonadota bacterium]
MIDTREKLVTACRDAGVLFSIDAVWEGNVPQTVRYQCENPHREFDIFVAHPEGFPFPNELLILWSTNGESVTGLLADQKKYIQYWYEDGPEEFTIIGTTYQQFACAIVGHVLGFKQPSDELAQELAEFFHIRYLDEVKEFVATDPGWEEGIAAFISKIESHAP